MVRIPTLALGEREREREREREKERVANNWKIQQE
jgi:hypothetical protein